MTNSWTFSTENGKVYVLRNGKRIVQESGLHEVLPDVQDVRVPLQNHLKNRLNVKTMEAVLIEFTNSKKLVLKIANFAWNTNSLSKYFKGANNSAEFCRLFKEINASSSVMDETQPPNDYNEEDIDDEDDIIPDTQPIITKKAKTKTTTILKKIPPIIGSTDVNNPDKERARSIKDKMVEGIFTVKIQNITECPEDIRLRDIDEAFVEQITKELESNSTVAPQPLALFLPNKALNDFNPECMAQYHFVCLGGNHLRSAMEKLKRDTVMAKIYVELSNEECLMVAKKHNEAGHFVKSMTNFDMIQLFRRQIRLETTNRLTDANEIKRWREVISKLLPTNKEIRSYQPLINIAMMAEKCYKLIILIFKMFENGDLKDQKIKKKPLNQSLSFTYEGVGPWRSIMTIEENTLYDLLKKVVQKDWSLEELQQACQDIKEFRKLQKKLMDHTGMEWDQVVESLYCGDRDEAESALYPYLKLSESSEFLAYIHRVNNERGEKDSTSKRMTTTLTICKADLVYLEENEANENSIREIHAKNIAGNISNYTLVSTSPNLEKEASKVGEFSYNRVAYVVGKPVKERELMDLHVLYIAQFGTKHTQVKTGSKANSFFKLDNIGSLNSIFDMFVQDDGTILIKFYNLNKGLLTSLNNLNCNKRILVHSEVEKKSLKRKFHFIEE